jgi:NAD(P)-dependent dehydrogenase (short-subunit alcohol dehydrogenase family)
MQIHDSVAFVTGANRGIGLSFVKELIAPRARKVYAAARNPEIIPFDGVEPVRLDVTDPETVASAAKNCADVTVRSGTITAQGRVVRLTRFAAIVEGAVTNSQREVCAQAVATFAVSYPEEK